MVTHVKLPKLTWTMEEGLIGRWLKEEGDKIEKGEPICEVETEKTIDAIEAPETGVLRKIIVPAGFSVPVNQTIAIIAEPDEEIPDINKIVEEARKIISKLAAVTPKIEGTGPGGRIVKEDILKAIEEAKAALEVMPATIKSAKIIPLTGTRKVIAERLSRSARTAVHVPISMEVDMSDTIRFCEKLRPGYEKRGKIHLSYTDLLVKAVAKTLTEYSLMNAILKEDRIEIMEDVNIGVAVALKRDSWSL